MNANAIVPSPPRIHSLVVICSVLKKKEPREAKAARGKFWSFYAIKRKALEPFGSRRRSLRRRKSALHHVGTIVLHYKTEATASEEF